MPALQIVALVVCLAVTAVAVALFAKVVGHFLSVFRLGQADATRTGEPGHAHAARWCASSSATPGCRGCRSWRWRTGSSMVGFGLLFFTLVTAFGQLFDPHLRAAADRPLLPVRVGHRVHRRRRRWSASSR